MQHYRYHTASSVQQLNGASLLSLAGSPNSTGEPNPTYFAGQIAQAQKTAMCLIAVSDVVGKRYYIPPSMLARILREADPVITVHEDALRFEGFSACGSTYIRLDIDQSACDVEKTNFGTTNVDFGGDMRAALSSVTANDSLQVNVRADGFEMHSESNSAIEKKVDLPIRWIKGFAEVQIHQASMQHRFTLKRVQAQQFIRGLPRVASDHLQWVSVVGAKARSSTQVAAGGVSVRGLHRLQVLERLCAHCNQVDVFFNDELGSSSWVMDFGGMRLHLVLNGEPWQGFSGDGLLLSDLVKQKAPVSKSILAQLAWQSKLDLQAIANQAQVTDEQIKIQLPYLMANGLIGFDLQNGQYFHRQLPYDYDSISDINPRYAAAHQLADNGCVSTKHLDERKFWNVASKDVSYRVESIEERYRCTCPWFERHQYKKGPCKHILAVEIMESRAA